MWRKTQLSMNQIQVTLVIGITSGVYIFKPYFETIRTEHNLNENNAQTNHDDVDKS